MNLFDLRCFSDICVWSLILKILKFTGKVGTTDTNLTVINISALHETHRYEGRHQKQRQVQMGATCADMDLSEGEV